MSPPPMPESYDSFLRESIDHFLSRFFQNGSDLSVFESISFRLVGNLDNPPLEIIWFYAAVKFHSTKSTTQDKIMMAKNLLQLLISCSSGCFPLTQVAVLAPVIYVLYHLMLEFLGRDIGLLRKIEGLVETVASYINIKCGSYLQEGEHGGENLMACFGDLLRVWTVDHIGISRDFDVLTEFFPLLSDEVRRGFNGRCGVGYLAGAVMNEIFLVRLCLKFGLGAYKEEMQRNMEILAVQTIKGFCSCYFLDGLFKMLLGPSLSVSTLLRSEDTVLLQKVVYDAVVLVDYSFLLSGRWIQSPDKIRKLALVWSLVADNAIQFARRISDQTRAVSYVNAFSESPLLNQITVWITNQADMEEKLRPNICTPKALSKWLLGLEDQGLRVFDDDILKVHAKAVVSNSRLDSELPELKQHGKTPQANICIYTEDEERRGYEVSGDIEMMDSFDGTCPTAVCSINTTATDIGRKRKEGRDDVGAKRVKQSKYTRRENSIEEKFSPLSHDGDTINAGNGRRTQMWF